MTKCATQRSTGAGTGPSNAEVGVVWANCRARDLFFVSRETQTTSVKVFEKSNSQGNRARIEARDWGQVVGQVDMPETDRVRERER